MNFKLLNQITSVLCLTVLMACGQSSDTRATLGSPSDPDAQDTTDFIIKSRSVLNISTGGQTSSSTVNTSSFQLSANQPIVVTNSPSSNFVMSNAGFSIPAITNTLLNFGYLEITALSDNDLRVCGPNGDQKCKKAMIRAYTTGTAGSGLYNSQDGYGAPLKMGQSTLSVVGLESTHAINLQKLSIPNSKNVIQLSDFPNSIYQVVSDFSNAGAGNYSTTLVIEYALSL